MPAPRARSSPAASSRLEMTTAMVAFSRPSRVASMSACRLLPRPEIKTPIRLRSGMGVAPHDAHPMPHRALAHVGGFVMHVVNRSVRRERLFVNAADYDAFVRVLVEALHIVPTRILAFCVMPNHWHLVMWPIERELPRFMHWLTMTHAKRWHAAHDTVGTGPVYQNRYYAVPVQTGSHLFATLRYVERNALRSGLVYRAEDWRWGSLWDHCNSCNRVGLAAWPISRPDDWVDHVNRPQTRPELEALRSSIRHGVPIGEASWSAATSQKLGYRRGPRGRPKR